MFKFQKKIPNSSLYGSTKNQITNGFDVWCFFLSVYVWFTTETFHTKKYGASCDGSKKSVQIEIVIFCFSFSFCRSLFLITQKKTKLEGTKTVPFPRFWSWKREKIPWKQFFSLVFFLLFTSCNDLSEYFVCSIPSIYTFAVHCPQRRRDDDVKSKYVHTHNHTQMHKLLKLMRACVVGVVVYAFSKGCVSYTSVDW